MSRMKSDFDAIRKESDKYQEKVKQLSAQTSKLDAMLWREHHGKESIEQLAIKNESKTEKAVNEYSSKFFQQFNMVTQYASK